MDTKPREISIPEWKEIMQVPAVRRAWWVDENTPPEQFAHMVYGARFDFISHEHDYFGDLYVLHGNTIVEPAVTLIRKNNLLEIVQ